jgi:hypothetical protein
VTAAASDFADVTFATQRSGRSVVVAIDERAREAWVEEETLTQERGLWRIGKAIGSIRWRRRERLG